MTKQELQNKLNGILDQLEIIQAWLPKHEDFDEAGEYIEKAMSRLNSAVGSLDEENTDEVEEDDEEDEE